jgi:hypothetical protein
MQKHLLFLVTLLVTVAYSVSAQEGIYGHEHTDVLKLRVGYGRQVDTYLSPMAYTGMQYGLGNEWWQAFRQDTKLGKIGKLANWGHVGRVDISVINYTNPARSNSFIGVQVAAGWGAFYCWKWIDDRLKVHVGPYLEGSFAMRSQGSNVNKVVSFDIAVDVMAMGGVSWSFYGKKTSYRLNYLLRTNLIGFDYLPEYWQSYYELTEGVHGTTRFSGHWNHNTVKHEITMDMQFAHSTWRIGAEHEFVRYGTANMHFVRNQLSVIIGCRWKYRIHANARL